MSVTGTQLLLLLLLRNRANILRRKFSVSRLANLNFEMSNLLGRTNPNFLAQNERFDLREGVQKKSSFFRKKS